MRTLWDTLLQGSLCQCLNIPIESTLWEDPEAIDGAKRMEPTDVMIPWDWLGTCTAYAIADVQNGKPQAAADGYTLSKANLGDGRPFFAGFTDDYEDWYVTYVGAFYPKSYVAAALGDSSTFYPGTESIPDRRFFHVNWYRLFPKEVGKLMADIISQNYFNFGPLVDENGQFKHRDLLDPETGEAPDYTGHKPVYPSVSSYLAYYAMVDAAFGMSYTGDGQIDMIDTMRIALEGSEDDLSAFELADPEDVVTFTHPVSGLTYRALKVGDNPIGYNMITRLNQRKTRYTRLKACLEDEDTLQNDVYCHCVRTSTPDNYCCNERNEDCPAPYLVVPGTDPAEDCTIVGLEERVESAREVMDNTANLIDDLRFFIKVFDNRF